MNGIGKLGTPIRIKVTPEELSPPKPPASGKDGGKEFKAALAEATERYDLKFSRHAIDRMELRNASIGRAELDRLGSAVTRAKEKGANESLVLLDELAFVVSVRNRTVITALQAEKEGVFTSIDSAVIA